MRIRTAAHRGAGAALVVLAMTAAACKSSNEAPAGGGQKSSPATATPAGSGAPSGAAAGAGSAASTGKAALTDTKATDTATGVFKARFETTKGAFTIEVHRDWSPNGADRFYHLVKIGFFD